MVKKEWKCKVGSAPGSLLARGTGGRYDAVIA
jgi:hypothetical protein